MPSHEAATSVTNIAQQAIQQAKDAMDAVKAAAADAVNTTPGDAGPLSGVVQGMKSQLMMAAESAIQIGKAGMTLAQAAIVKGRSRSVRIDFDRYRAVTLPDA